MIPKKKYRDKVRERLDVVRSLLGDRGRVEEILRRVLTKPNQGPAPSALHNAVEAMELLLDRDVPALLDALDELASRRLLRIVSPISAGESLSVQRAGEIAAEELEATECP